MKEPSGKKPKKSEPSQPSEAPETADPPPPEKPDPGRPGPRMATNVSRYVIYVDMNRNAPTADVNKTFTEFIRKAVQEVGGSVERVSRSHKGLHMKLDSGRYVVQLKAPPREASAIVGMVSAFDGVRTVKIVSPQTAKRAASTGRGRVRSAGKNSLDK